MRRKVLIGLLIFFGLLGAKAAISAPVTGLSATNNEGMIDLSWTEPTDAGDTATTYTYVVERSGSGSGPWTDISGPLPEGSAEYTDANTINNETWYYQVGASKTGGPPYEYSKTESETAYYLQSVSGLTVTAAPIICYETNGTPDSVPIRFYLDAGPAGSSAKRVTITLLEIGEEIGSITLYGAISGTHTVYWDGSWDNMVATSIGANTWVITGRTDPWIKHNSAYGITAVATNYNDDVSDVAESGALIEVDVVHFNNVIQEYTVVGSDPPAYVPPYKITYQLTKEAYVTIHIYEEDTITGGLGTLVRRIEEETPRPGELLARELTNTQVWDGKNDTGLIVPNGKYIMTLEAHEVSGCNNGEDYADTFEIVWAVDVLRLTDWSAVAITPANPTGSIDYTLSHDANCTIAIYPEGTEFTNDDPNTDPIIILIGGGPREAGSHTEEWVGVDSDGLLVPNAIYTYTISAGLHGVKAVDYVGNDCPFYGTIVVNREPHEIESPTNLTATNMDGVIQLSWTAPTNNIGDVTYILYRGVNASISPSSYSDSHTGLTSTQFSDAATVDVTVYYYVVTAIDSATPANESNPSNLASAQAVYPKPPTIPGNLTTETVTRKIKLTWDASQVTGGSTGSVFYRIYRSKSSSVDTNDTANRIANNILTTGYTDQDSTVISGQAYYYRVTAVDDSNNLESDGSNESWGQSSFAAPANLSAVNNDGFIDLTWEATSGIGSTTYNVYRDTDPSVDTGSTQVATGLNSTNWTDVNTENNTVYYYVVTGVDSFDGVESLPSDPDFERAVYPIPPAPSDLTAKCVNRTIELLWTGVSDTASKYVYNIYRSTSPSVDITDPDNLISGGGNATKFTDQKIIDQVRVYYVVTTEDLSTGLESGPSNEEFETSVFESPTELSAENYYGAIDLSWKPTRGIGNITYNIYRDITPDVSTSSSLIVSGLMGTKYRDTATTDGITYYYIVTGADDYDMAESLLSDMASDRSEYLGAPTVPGNLSAKTVDRKIKLAWEASEVTGISEGSITYNIYRDTSPHGTIPDPNNLLIGGITSTNYVDEAIDDQLKYYYVVTAVDDSSRIESVSSNEVLAVSYFLPPEGLTATNEKGLINLTWTETKGIGLITYNIYRGTTSTSLTEVDSGVMQAKWQDKDTANGVTYYYMVTATDSYDDLESDPTNTVSERAIYPPELLSIGVERNVEEIEYETNNKPDSVTITFTINAGDSDSKGNPGRVERTVISITDNLSGQEVYTFEFENWPSGTYSVTWDGTWDVPGQRIKHNGSYKITGTITNYDGASPLPGKSWVYVDVVHFNNVVKEYINIGQNPEAHIQPYNVIYQLTKDALVTIQVYEYDETDTNNLGNLVRTIVDETPRPGEGLNRDFTNEMLWDGKDDSGKLVPNGIYILTLDANESKLSKVPGTDRAIQRQVSLAADTLRLLDLESTAITGPSELATISYTFSTDMTVYINIYQPGTTFSLDADSNPVASKSLVKTLVAAPRGKGSHTESWDGTNDIGQIVTDGIYVFTVMALDTHGNRATDRYGNECPFYGTIAVDQVDEADFSKESVFAYPNPVRGDGPVTFQYDLENDARITIKVFTLTGTLVFSDKFDDSSGKGRQRPWNLENNKGKSLATGLYIYSIEMDDGSTNKSVIKKLAVIR
ncbi:T9SS type A sorting domain-containing protein [bacterium]|nr:T9SS type A sorting domain-containing protein [bacterium]MBU1614642.1 T9SS type A sorting domain-containing protein [bacterium]